MIDPAPPRDAPPAADISGQRSLFARAPKRASHSARARSDVAPEDVDIADLTERISLRLDAVLDDGAAQRPGAPAEPADGEPHVSVRAVETVPDVAATDAKLQAARRRLADRRVLAQQPAEPRARRTRRWKPGRWLPELLWGVAITALSALVAVAVL